MKKFIKINQNIKGEYSIEDIIKMYKPYIKQKSSFFLDELKKYGQAHSLHVEVEDLEQLAIIGLIKAYNKYDINFKSEGYDNSDDAIGFFPFMDKTVKGELLKFIRDTLFLRKKDYNIFEIGISFLDEPIPSKKDDGKDINLLESLDLHEKDVYEDIDNKLEVESLLSCLDEQSKLIIQNYYFHNKTQNEIASMLNITQVQVSRILNKSIKKMKNYSEDLNNKEREVMKKRKTIDFDCLIKHLEDCSNKNISLDTAIKDYAYLNQLEINDVYSSLERRKTSYDKIKDLYKKNSKKAIKEKEAIQSEPKVKEVIKPEVEVIEHDIVVKEEAKVSKDIKHIKKQYSNNLNILKDINIINLTVDINGLSVNFSPNGIDLCNVKLVGLKVEDLVKLQENIQKVIEINNTLYK